MNGNHWKIQMDESIFIPMKTLNEVRRQALEALEEEILNLTGEKKQRKESRRKEDRRKGSSRENGGK